VSNDIRGLAREASDSVERIKDSVQNIPDQITLLRRDLGQIIAAAEVEAQNTAPWPKPWQTSPPIWGYSQRPTALSSRAPKASFRARRSRRSRPGRSPQRLEETSSAVRQAATASAEQAQGADDLAAAIEEIASLSDELMHEHD
jgi:methyl-accepting chemotaxis protein